MRATRDGTNRDGSGHGARLIRRVREMVGGGRVMVVVVVSVEMVVVWWR